MEGIWRHAYRQRGRQSFQAGGDLAKEVKSSLTFTKDMRAERPNKRHRGFKVGRKRPWWEHARVGTLARPREELFWGPTRFVGAENWFERRLVERGEGCLLSRPFEVGWGNQM